MIAEDFSYILCEQCSQNQCPRDNILTQLIMMSFIISLPVTTRFYVGSSPWIVIADVHLAKEIMVKEFENFTDQGYVVSRHITTVWYY